MLISTRFAQSPQIHRVAMPGAARTQLTFYADPVRTAIWRPEQGKYFLFAKDTGGGEFYQFYRDDQPSGTVTRLTDGQSRNTCAGWNTATNAIRLADFPREDRSRKSRRCHY